jgi:hypothetical protein
MSVQYDLSLTTTTSDLNLLPMPEKGKGQIGIARNNDILYFRVIDSSGHRIVDTNEGSLKDKAQNIGELKKRLKDLWPPREVSAEQKKQVIKAVRSVLSIKEIEDGLGILGSNEWYKLQAFVLQSKHRSPTTAAKMAHVLGIEAPPGDKNWTPEKDKHWDPDYTKTTKDYFELANYCDDSDSGLDVAKRTGFWNVIKPGMIELADDIVSYQTTQDVIYTRLQEVIDNFDMDNNSPSVAEKLAELERRWNQQNPSAESLTIKKRLISAYTRLHREADERAKKAGKLEVLVTGFHNNLLSSQVKFEGDYNNYQSKYGTQGKAVTDLRRDRDLLQQELDQRRNKERDEIIALGTSPLYLILWPIGILIMAGVQIGVGVDLALLREKIKKLVGQVDDKNKELTTKEKFMTGYESMRTMTFETSNSINKVLPAIAQLKDGWHALAADLENIVRVLNKGGGGDSAIDDWFMAGTGLKTARRRWEDLADRADYFRKNATIREAPSPRAFVEALKAA